MVQVRQAFNKKIGAWVKYKKYANGKTVITNVKQREPKEPFFSVPKKK